MSRGLSVVMKTILLILQDDKRCETSGLSAKEIDRKLFTDYDQYAKKHWDGRSIGQRIGGLLANPEGRAVPVHLSQPSLNRTLRLMEKYGLIAHRLHRDHPVFWCLPQHLNEWEKEHWVTYDGHFHSVHDRTKFK